MFSVFLSSQGRGIPGLWYLVFSRRFTPVKPVLRGAVYPSKAHSRVGVGWDSAPPSWKSQGYPPTPHGQDGKSYIAGGTPLAVTQEDFLVTAYDNWWLVRVILAVDLLFLPRNFGLMVGTYEGLLLFCECTLGDSSICMWWGHLTTTCCHQTFSHHRWWGP